MFEINLRGGKGAIYQQLKSEVIRLCGMGILKPDDQLPSVRSLARELGINPNTVAKAYSQLEADGIIYSVSGRGSFIRLAPDQMTVQREKVLENYRESVKKAKTLGLSLETLKGEAEKIFTENTETIDKKNKERNEKDDLL